MFPICTFKVSNRMTPRHAWMTKGLMKSCIKKSKLYKIYCKDRTGLNKDKYVTYRNKLKTLLHIAKKTFYSDKLSQVKGNMRQTWKVINTVLNKNPLSKISNSFIINGLNVTCPHDIAEEFNAYFTKIGSSLAESIPTSQTSFQNYLTGQPNQNSIFFNPTTCSK